MKLLIRCPDRPARWIRGFFPDTCPYLVKVTNKPLLEYFIDLCVVAGLQECRIVMDEPDPQVERTFGTGGKWGLRISYGICRHDDDLRRMLDKNAGFADGAGLLLMSGFFFPHYDKNDPPGALLSKVAGGRIRCATGYVTEITENGAEPHAGGTPGTRPDALRLSALGSINDYYRLSLRILAEESTHYVLPGYGKDAREFVGRNVRISRSTQFRQPVMLGNGVDLEEQTVIGPGAVVGDRVFVDNGTAVTESVVYDNTYVGPDLEIKGKIVNRNNLIAPETGDMVPVIDPFLVSSVEADVLRHWGKHLVDGALALLLLIVQLPFFALLLPVVTVLGGKPLSSSVFYRDKAGNTITMAAAAAGGPSLPQRVFLRLSLDKVPQLIHVICARVFLAGNMLLEADEGNRRFVDELIHYTPGVFNYSGSIPGEKDADQLRMNEFYYLVNRSMLMDVRITAASLWNRLVHGTR